MESNEFYRLMKEAQTGNLTSYENGNATYAVPSNGITSDNFYDLMNAARSGNLSRDENGNFSYKKPVSTGASSSDAVKNAIAAAKQAATKAGNEVYSFLQGTDEAAQNNWLNDLNRQNDEQQANIDRLNTRLDEIKEADSNTPFSEKIKTLITGEKSEAAKARDEEKVNLQKALEQALEENKLTKSKLDVAQQAYEKRTIRSSVEAAREGAASYTDLIKDYSQSLDKLNKDRATAIEDLNRIRNGAGYYGAASTYEEDKARQEADEKDALARLEAAEKQIQRITGMRNYAFARSANDKGADAIIRQGEELARTAKEQYLAGNMPDPTTNADYRTWVDSNPGKTAKDYAEQQYADREPNNLWTQEEKNLYYILMTDSPERAYQYAVGVNSAINREVNERTVSSITDLFPNYDLSKEAREGRSGAANALMTLGNKMSDAAGIVGGVATAPTKLFNWLDNIYQNNERDGYYAGNNTPRISDYTDRLLGQNTERLNSYGTIREDVPILGGKGLGDLYQLVESVAQSMTYGAGLSKAFGVGATTAAGIQAAQKAAKLSTGLIFFGQAADSSYNEYVQRGMSREQAAVGSFFAGLAEAMGEELSIDHLISGDIADGLAKYVAKQSFIEASEEGFTNVLNLFGDELAARMTGGESKMRQDIEALKRSGMSEEDAKRQVWKQFVDDTVFDMLGGAISGGLSSGAYAAPNALYNYVQNRNNQNQQNQQTAQPAQTTQTETSQRPTTRNPLYEALNSQTPAAETATVAENAATEEPAPATPATAQAAETPTGETTTPTLEERRADLQRRLEDAMKRAETAPEEEWAALGEELDALDAEGRQLQTEETQQARVQNGEVSKGYGTPENHIDRRTSESVGNVGMKSFQFDNPQLHGYYVEAAQALFDEVQNAEDADYGRKVNPNTRYERGSAITGPIRRLMDMGLTKPQIVKCLQDIIADNGQENYAAAKRVELVLNDMLTNGWQGQRGRNDWHEANADYIAAKDAIDGGIKADSWERFLAQNELSLIDGTVTEEELRAEWEQMHPQEEAATVAEPEAASEPAQPVETTSAGTKQNAQTGTDSRGYTGPLVDTQDRVFETNLSEEEKKVPGLTAEEARHIQHHDAEVDARAKARIQNGITQARKNLLSAESWSDEDTATAGYIIQAELAAAERATSPEKKAEIYKRIAELKKQWNKQGTEQGRALRQRQRFVAEDIVSTAADILYGEKKNDRTQKALRKLNPQAKDEIMSKVRDFAERFNDMQKGKGTVGDLIQLIKDVSVQRRTTGLFSRENGRPVDFALSEVAKQDGGVDFLKELATTQIKSIASDYLKPGIIDQIKSWRFMAMLSNAATTTANAGSNFVFGSFMEALSGNLALPFDMLMSQVTGQREVAGELGAFSKTKWQGSYDAMLRSFLEVTLDAETAQADYGYKELKGGTFKMVGNPLERLLATMQKYQGYALKTTDQAAKGGTEAQVRKGLGKLAEQGKAKAENIDALADQEAKYRTLQTEGEVSRLVQGGRRLIDEIRFLHIGNERTGKYGLGSDIMPFAQVPANAVAVTLESNPAIGAVKAIVETAKVLADGKNVEPGQQAKAARAWGRVANGVAVAATFAALAAKGYLRDEDDENKDIAAQRKAEGRSGVQLNISALLRGDPSEREHDLWIDFSWIPPLNGLANFGVDMYRAYTEDGHISFKDVTLASGDALASAFMDFPAVSKISSMIQTYRYSEADGILGKALETGVTGAAQTASSILVPNAVRAAAAGLDPYERDVYNTDTYGEGIVNNLISGIPGLRETLPERLDTFGQPIKNEGGALHFLDKTLIPGNVNRHDRQSAASKYVEDLIDKTGDKKLQPSRNPPYKATLGDGDDKQSVKLTAAERREYQQTRGQAILEMTEALAGSQAANGATDEQKALFNAIKNAAKHQAEAELAESKGIEHTASQIQGKDFMSFAVMGAPDAVLDRLAENGMTGKGRNLLWDTLHSNGESPQNIVSAIDQIDPDGNGRASQADLYAYLRDKDNLTAEQKQSIWETYNPTGKTSYANYAAKNGGDSSKASQPTGNLLYDYTR